jgi:predicted MFS family arabinose efflux permease
VEDALATRWIVLASCIFARVAFAYQFQSLAVVAPGLIGEFGLDALSVGTLVGLYMLPGFFLAIPGGMLSQWVGERRFLTGCLAAMVAGALICAFASGYWSICVGRLLSGLGATGANVVMAKIAIDWFQDEEIATAMALFLAGYPAGIGLALVTLGTLATPEGWSHAFLITGALGFVAFVVFAATYRPAQLKTEGSTPAESSMGEVGMVCVAGAIWALYNAAYTIVVSFVPLFLHSAGMASAAAASLVGIGLWVAIVAAPIGGVLADRSRKPNLLIVAGVLIWGLGLMLVIPWADSPLLLLTLIIVTAFIGSLPPGAIVALASEVLRPQARSAGMGIYYTWLYAGLALGPMLAGLVSNLTGDPAAPVYLIGVLALLTVIALGLFRALQARGFPAAVRRGET